MCHVLSVKPSSYTNGVVAISANRNHCELLFKAAHSESKERYGYERLHAKLTEQGHDISLSMVRSIKKEHDVKCRRHKRFEVNIDSNHNKLIYPNVLEQKFDVKRPNKAWVGDITYIWTAEC